MTMIDVSHVTMQFNMANDKIISLKETVVALLRGKLKYKKNSPNLSIGSGSELYRRQLLFQIFINQFL